MLHMKLQLLPRVNWLLYRPLLSIKDMKQILAARGVSTARCVEKNDFIKLLEVPPCRFSLSMLSVLQCMFGILVEIDPTFLPLQISCKMGSLIWQNVLVSEK